MFTTKSIERTSNLKKIGIYRHVRFSDYAYPNIGWKIHISAARKDVIKILTIVGDYCCQYEINFKYISDEPDFSKNISSKESRGYSGKFITIYPKNVEHAQRIMDQLSTLLRSTDGPLILSDYEYRRSKNVFFRYGFLIQPTGGSLDIQGPNGKIFHDFDGDFPRTPEWIKVPSKWILPEKESLLITKYHPEAIIRRSNSGNIYLGKTKQSDEVIIKEARRNIEVYSGVNVTEFKENAWNVARELQGLAEDPVERIEERNSIFYIYKKINGRPLSSYIGANSFFLSQNPRQIRTLFKKEKRIVERIWLALKVMDRKNITNLDIHPDNIFVTESDDVKFIDFETANRLDYQVMTYGYWSARMDSENSKVKDLRRFGFLVMFLFGQANRYLQTLDVEKAIELTCVFLKPLGEVGGLKRLLEELLISESPSKEEVEKDIAKLEIKKINQLQLAVRHVVHKKNTINNCFKRAVKASYNDVKSPMTTCLTTILGPEKNSNQARDFLDHNCENTTDMNLGLTGIGGILAIIAVDPAKFAEKIHEIDNEVRKRLIKRYGRLFLFNKQKGTYIDPYVLNGEAGFLLGQALLPTSYWIPETKELCLALASPYAKSLNYSTGLLGLTDVVLALSTILESARLENEGSMMLEQLKLIKRTFGDISLSWSEYGHVERYDTGMLNDISKEWASMENNEPNADR